MRRKRLQHHADIFCQMFCGWRLMNDHETLSELGSGSLQIDVLTGDCMFDDKLIEKLKIAGEIDGWFRDEILAHKIPIELISCASLSVQLQIEPLIGPRRTTEIWADANAKTTYTSCHIFCESRISTDELDYASQLRDYEEWPDKWWVNHNMNANTPLPNKTHT